MSCISTDKNCPLCSNQMQVEIFAPANEHIPVASCSECLLTILVADLKNEEMVEKSVDYHLREMLGTIARGERFISIINDLPFFPNSRTDQIVTLMSSEISLPLSRCHQSLPPLPLEDQDLVKAVLGL